MRNFYSATNFTSIPTVEFVSIHLFAATNSRPLYVWNSSGSPKSKFLVMSDETSSWYEKSVKVFDELQKGVLMKVKPEGTTTMKRVLEVLSALLWVIMVLWIELGAIVIFLYLLVSIRNEVERSRVKRKMWNKYVRLGNLRHKVLGQRK